MRARGQTGKDGGSVSRRQNFLEAAKQGVTTSCDSEGKSPDASSFAPKTRPLSTTVREKKI